MGNLALNKWTTANSYMKPYSASRAVDGSSKPVQRWVSSKVPAWIMVDLGNSYWINRWIVRHMGAAGWRSPDYNLSNFRLQISNDNSRWTDVDVVTRNTDSTTDRTFNAVFTRFVRVNVISGININPKLVSLVELEVYEAPPTSQYLSGLTMSNGALQPTFAKNIFNYSSSVNYNTSSITLTPIAEDPNATIKVNGQVVQSGATSLPVNLSVGNNIITVEVTSLIGALKATYTINVNRQRSVNLSNLTTSVGTLSPAFNTDTTSYTVNVSYDIRSFTVTPTAEDGTASITVNSQSVASGQASQALGLNVGDNTVTVVVSADGEQKTYSINVVRASSPYLTSITMTQLFTPNFGPTIYEYTSDVTATMVKITPSAEGNITINGTAVASAQVFKVTLNQGQNKVEVIVTSKIGVDQKTYTFIITRT